MRLDNTLIKLALLLIALLTSSGTYAQSFYQDPVLGPRDVLDIQVYNEPALSMTVVVSASGDFAFPLLERVQAQGLTASELGKKMEDRLLSERFLRTPSVNIMIKEQRHSAVMLTGAVIEKGLAPIYPGMSLREMLSEQGGVLEDQAGPTLVVKRRTGEEIQVLREAMYTAQAEGKGDLALEPGDTLLVPFAKYIYVNGAVNSPGGFPLTRDLTIADALGLAGGRSEQGGRLLMWYRPDAEDGPQVVSFSYKEYGSNTSIRTAKLAPGDSLFVTQNDFVFVGGEVNRPGSYPWKPGMTMLAAVVEAGDRNVVASGGITLVRVNDEGEQRLTQHSYNDLRKNGRDIPLEPGDIIHVQSNLLFDIPYTIRRLNPFSFSLTVAESALLQ